MKNYVIEWRRKAGCSLTVGVDIVTAESEDAAKETFFDNKMAEDRIGDYQIIRTYPEE